MVPPIIGESPVIHNIKTLIGKVAKTGENILICGETGVGKDLVAQNLYHQSNRVGKPFVKLNCACLTESLFEIYTHGRVRPGCNPRVFCRCHGVVAIYAQ